jgi:hypothetical protein
MSETDYHMFREDRAVKWRRIAGHVEKHPEDLDIALENLDRWEALGRVHMAPIHEWRSRIHASRTSPRHMREFIDFLAEPNHDAEPIKSCSPFVGLPIAQTPPS